MKTFALPWIALPFVLGSLLFFDRAASIPGLPGAELIAFGLLATAAWVFLLGRGLRAAPGLLHLKQPLRFLLLVPLLKYPSLAVLHCRCAENSGKNKRRLLLAVSLLLPTVTLIGAHRLLSNHDRQVADQRWVSKFRLELRNALTHILSCQDAPPRDRQACLDEAPQRLRQRGVEMRLVPPDRFRVTILPSKTTGDKRPYAGFEVVWRLTTEGAFACEFDREADTRAGGVIAQLCAGSPPGSNARF